MPKKHTPHWNKPRDWLDTNLTCPFCGASPSSTVYSVLMKGGKNKQQIYKCKHCKTVFSLEVIDE